MSDNQLWPVGWRLRANDFSIDIIQGLGIIWLCDCRDGKPLVEPPDLWIHQT